jgi:hypothetical protein
MSKKIDVQKEVQIHFITEGPAKGWTHTHGLARFNRPELEIRDVPALFSTAACALLNGVADYMLNRATNPVLAGQNMEWDRATVLHFHEGLADEEAGYDRNHYETPVLTITSREHECGRCTSKVKA